MALKCEFTVWGALVPSTHKTPDAEKESCPIVSSEIVNFWLSSHPMERSLPIVNPTKVTTGHQMPVRFSPMIQPEKSPRMFHNV